MGRCRVKADVLIVPTVNPGLASKLGRDIWHQDVNLFARTGCCWSVVIAHPCGSCGNQIAVSKDDRSDL